MPEKLEGIAITPKGIKESEKYNKNRDMDRPATNKKKVPQGQQQEEPEKPTMEYNNKTWQSWMNLIDHIPDIEDKIPHGVVAPEQRKKEFLSQVDLDQGPIERNVMVIVRFKAKNRDDKEAKEYLRYHEDWQAKI
jgi:hypothetical protein